MVRALTQRKHFHHIVAWCVCWNVFTGSLPSNALGKSVTVLTAGLYMFNVIFAASLFGSSIFSLCEEVLENDTEVIYFVCGEGFLNLILCISKMKIIINKWY
jgi:hypothetical protein